MQSNKRMYTISIDQRQEKSRVQHVKMGLALVLTMSIMLMSRPTAVLCNVLPAEFNELMENNGGGSKHDIDNLGQMDKRKSWQALHGSWGKRSFEWRNPTENAADSAENEPEAWLHLTMPVNTREDRKNRDKISLIYLSNEKSLNNNNYNNDNGQVALMRDVNDSIEDQLERDDAIISQKRNLKNVNGVWSKRRNVPAWKIFHGAWDKREPGWNNLKGMWGKRSIKQWQKLHSGWGKRDPSPAYDDIYNNNSNN